MVYSQDLMKKLLATVALTLLLTACFGKAGTMAVNGTRSSESGGVIAVQKLNELMPTGKQLVDPTHGKEENLAYGAMNGEGGVLANGVVTAHYFQDSTTIIGVQLNIAVAKAGAYYEAWLENDDGSAPIDMGQMQNGFNDVRYSVRFTSSQNLINKHKVVVSLEQKASATTPGTVVASGTLQPTSR
jgi:hypothetical protein